MTINFKNHIKDTCWAELENNEIPFLNYHFFHSLESSGVVGEDSGWNPLFFEEPKKSVLYSFVKSHSYGEYIFDWDWANSFHHHNLPYYPKLTSMIPFTPATTSHFIGGISEKVMNSYEDFYCKNSFLSSHFLFLPGRELEFFKSYNYLIRDSFQYHFYNENYQSFEGFLSKLKRKKAKQIRRERAFSKDIKFQCYTGEQLDQTHAIEMFNFYQRTLLNKQAISYLNLNFFITIFSKLKNNICYIQSTRCEQPVAGALFFYDANTLYGRYWGTTEHIPNLHFELCYYRGIDFCIEKNIKVFEAGAQGEHKIARGFKPVKTFSAHKVKHHDFHQAIYQYVENEKVQIDKLLLNLNDRQPFLKKKD
ncbi:MAG: GNAT family N-acetyltransferase [Bacteriovoracaceae bacterium]|jgi:uncharacterized protein|nr:GNAT family N-acetyltransferase [Bacteriovoracaceae bacterium]